MKKITLLDRLRYAFDNTMSRGLTGLILWLALITGVLVLTASVFVAAVGGDSDKSLPELVWDILYQTLTPNPVDPKAGSTFFLGTMLFVTLSSLLLVSILIGILTNAIDHHIEDLRKGHSLVIEKGHTLVLGWSAQIFTIISELVIANENQGYACITILADKDKIEMEDEVRAKVPHLGPTHIVCRTGSPLDMTDLETVSPYTARSIIILSPESDARDTFVIKTMLALTNNPNRRTAPYHIVAAIHEEHNMDIAALVGRDEVELVLVSEMISRVTVQTCRQSGLSVVYTELLNFEGDEIYFQDEPALVGKTFGEALLAYEDSAVIGLFRQNSSDLLNPRMDTIIETGDQIIAISEDDDTVRLSGLANLHIDVSSIQTPASERHEQERTLILGWNRNALSIINGLEHYAAPNSETVVVADVADAERKIKESCAGLKNQTVVFKQADTTSRRVLNGLAVASFQHIIVLSYSDTFETQEADARTLTTLLHLRDLRERSGKEFTIVSEMLDIRDRVLADVTRADDFVVSDQLISLVLAQVSENKFLNAVFTDLFTPEGSEIYLKLMGEYVQLGQPLNFYTVVESARRRSHVAIGYRLLRDAHDASKAYGVVVNPDKSMPVTFEHGDKIIVIASH